MKRGTEFIFGILALSLLFGITGFVLAQTTQSTTASVTVNEFLSVTLSNAPVTFSSMDPGETQNASVGNGFPLNATIGSETNVNTNVTTETNQTNFASGSNTFSVSNMVWEDVVFNSTETGTAYSTSPATVCSGLSANGNCGIYHQVSVPSAQAAGTYNVGITVSAIKA
ncbi:MAG: hypothetical protein ACE5ES_01860 [Candidatus Nanoarchaeia archaeon]